MSDLLLQLSGNPNARKLIKQLGLPIPMPQTLRRAEGPWTERPLQDRDVVVGGGAGGGLHAVLARTLTEAGANPYVVADANVTALYKEPGEAFGRPATQVEGGEAAPGVKASALVFDATTVDSIAKLRKLYDFFHPWMRSLDKCGRIVVIGRPEEAAKSPDEAAARAALAGFLRSAAKEIGKRGATGNLIVVDGDADDRLAPVLRWVLSDRSAFVDGQTFRVTSAASGDIEARWTRGLEGKKALVTGGARGIGAATAAALAAEGAKVVVLDRPADDGPASRTAREVGGEVLLVDVTDADAPETIVRFFEDLGGLDVIVHNAGVTRDKTLAKMSPEQWDLALAVNLAAIERITGPLLDGPMNFGGRIVALSSVSGIAGNVGQTNYGASKAGVVGWVRALAPKVAKRGITVNAVAPGFIETRLTDRMPVMIREVARRFNALSQGGRPDDVAQLVTLLASPGAQGLTGNLIRACGLNMVGA